MNKFSKKSVFLTIAAAVIVLAIFVYLFAPSYLYKKAIDGMRKDAGLTVKSVNIPDFKIVYLEGGTGEPIIMLHGFGGDKDNWLRFAKYFTPGYRVIIPDLPGFGESSKPETAQYTIMSQVEKLNALVKELKLTDFHIIGNSMGGNIAGAFTAAHPEMVKTLGLFDSGGVKSPMKSELHLIMETGINPLIVKNTEDYDRLLAFNFYKPIPIPSFVKKVLAEKAAKASEFNQKIFKESTQADFLLLESKLGMIKAPTLIVWGDSDRVIHVSSVAIFEKKIKNARSVIIKECGHLPMLEKPQETADAYKNFLKDKNTGDNRTLQGQRPL
ncbi:MAG: alpha/beta hydrolase [Deltaproteobacteria bacterium HGW-Deltaproteobacteria-1]|jgi:pimeloyl-ACP methyl ester carboxylesterase|nr:MAG: alpha/beta hydrolase [Deltaproteobacteria bacterium HGW-Deltaproteobacteria-1]